MPFVPSDSTGTVSYIAGSRNYSTGTTEGLDHYCTPAGEEEDRRKSTKYNPDVKVLQATPAETQITFSVCHI